MEPLRQYTSTVTSGYGQKVCLMTASTNTITSSFWLWLLVMIICRDTLSVYGRGLPSINSAPEDILWSFSTSLWARQIWDSTSPLGNRIWERLDGLEEVLRGCPSILCRCWDLWAFSVLALSFLLPPRPYDDLARQPNQVWLALFRITMIKCHDGPFRRWSRVYVVFSLEEAHARLSNCTSSSWRRAYFPQVQSQSSCGTILEHALQPSWFVAAWKMFPAYAFQPWGWSRFRCTAVATSVSKYTAFHLAAGGLSIVASPDGSNRPEVQSRSLVDHLRF
jgi:hypothetical protein